MNGAAQGQGMQGMQGGNGNGGAGGVGAGFPAPAGYTAELSYIHAMVEELSRQLADNQRVLGDVVTDVGRVRQRAHAQNLGNDELLAEASDALAGQDANLDATVSALALELDAARKGKEANGVLLSDYAAAMAAMLKQFHEYKEKHVQDVAAWHRSYRHQLAEARAENTRLRDQIWQMQEAAARANASLRAFRSKYDDDPERWERRVTDKALRQELRFWKRMAMPSLSDESNLPADSALTGVNDAGEPYWSDDDDLIDVAEKERLRALEREMERKMLEEQHKQQQQQQQHLLDQHRALQQQQQQRALQQQQQHYAELAQRQAPNQDPTTDTGDDSDTGSVILAGPGQDTGVADLGSLDSLGSLGDDDDDDDDDDVDDANRLPAVPNAPTSAPTPANIVRMEQAVSALRRGDSSSVSGDVRPGSAGSVASAVSASSTSSGGSTGSMHPSEGSDRL